MGYLPSCGSMMWICMSMYMAFSFYQLYKSFTPLACEDELMGDEAALQSHSSAGCYSPLFTQEETVDVYVYASLTPQGRSRKRKGVKWRTKYVSVSAFLSFADSACLNPLLLYHSFLGRDFKSCNDFRYGILQTYLYQPLKSFHKSLLYPTRQLFTPVKMVL